MLRFSGACYITPSESIKLYNTLLAALTDRLSLLRPGTASDSYAAGLESRTLSALSSEGCVAYLDDFKLP